MVKNIMYGTNDYVSFFVQTSCAAEHLGGECDCINYGSYLSEEKARGRAEELGLEFMVPVIKS